MSSRTLYLWLAENALLFSTFAGSLVGLVLGFLLKPLALSEDTKMLISYPGELFMRVLKLMILPFIISCLIIGTSDSVPGNLLRMSSRTLYLWLAENALLFSTFAGSLVGLVLGFLLKPLALSEDTKMLISYPGELFMRVLKLMILPFIISCLIIGTATLNIKKNGRIAIRTIIYILATSALNVALGLVLVLAIQPGHADLQSNRTVAVDTSDSRLLDSFLDMGRNLISDNIFQSTFEQTRSEYYDPDKEKQMDVSTLKVNNDSDTLNHNLKRRLTTRNGTNTLGIIFFCSLFGSILGSIGPKSAPVIEFFTVIYQVMLKMLLGAMWFTPIGVCSIICGKLLSLENIGVTLTQLSWFILTVTAGVLIYQLLILQSIYYVFVRKNPYHYYRALGPGIITAFATASKAAALPVTLQLLDNQLRVDHRVTRFIMSIGTINMDGTALFLSVSVCFLAQINNISLTIGDIMTIGISCTFASMSSATVPSAALVLVTMLCSTVNSPPEDVALLFAVDWFVDRMRTTNNLLGDCYACAVIESLSKEDLEESDVDEEYKNYNNSYVSCAGDFKIQNNGCISSV